MTEIPRLKDLPDATIGPSTPGVSRYYYTTVWEGDELPYSISDFGISEEDASLTIRERWGRNQRLMSYQLVAIQTWDQDKGRWRRRAVKRQPIQMAAAVAA